MQYTYNIHDHIHNIHKVILSIYSIIHKVILSIFTKYTHLYIIHNKPVNVAQKKYVGSKLKSPYVDNMHV